MTFVYAGEYASDVLYRTQGAAGNAAVTVTTSADEPATLYTDATKDTPLASNVVDTDPYGNLTFFADPGTYTCSVGSASFTAVVAVNPLEPGGGSGSVTSVAVESANGLAGTVADSTTTPQITLSTTATGVLKGASGVIGAATAGTDYLAPSGSGAALTGITAAQVGADASGAAATAQGNAESFATSAVATETSRAEAAEALLAPLASPVLTGSPTAPTKTALTNSADIATTAYTDAAVAAETSRAEGAEAANASAVSAETSRAEAAEALRAPLASPALTGSPTAPTQSTGDSSTKLATTAFVTAAVKTGAQAAPAGFTPSNPSSTSSTTPVMMGFGGVVTYTPAGSGLVIVNVTFFTSNTSNDPNTVGVRYGTGTAPSFGAAATGTRFGAVGDTPVLGNGSTPYGGCFAATALLTLAAGTPYWFDAVLTAAGGHTSVVENAGFTIFELP